MEKVLITLQILFLVLSILAIIAKFLNLFFKKDKDNVKKILNSFIFIFFIISIVLGLIFYNENSKLKDQLVDLEKKIKERIVILLPLDRKQQDKAPFQDGKRQAYGLIDLIEADPELTCDFHFVVYNHDMDISKARQYIKEELKKGTEYFVCTMSDIGYELSYDFPNLVEKYKVFGKDPKLVLTVTSAPDINIKVNRVYRFYITSEKEAEALAKEAFQINNITNLVSISVKGKYGDGAVEEFEKQWTETYSKPDIIKKIKVQNSWEKDKVLEEIKDKIGEFDRKRIDAFFVVHFGEGLDNIISALEDLKIYAPIFATSTLSIEAWRPKNIMEYLDQVDWITCVPVSKKGGGYQNGDVVRDFTYFTLHRLIYAIKDSRTEMETNFDKAWCNTVEPTRIEFKIDPDNRDSNIKMIADTHLRKK